MKRKLFKLVLLGGLFAAQNALADFTLSGTIQSITFDRSPNRNLITFLIFNPTSGNNYNLSLSPDYLSSQLPLITAALATNKPVSITVDNYNAVKSITLRK